MGDGVGIIEFCRRTGLSADTVRYWTSRYGLFTPVDQGGRLLYGTRDELVARRVVSLRVQGVSLHDAARAIVGREDGLKDEYGQVTAEFIDTLNHAVHDLDPVASLAVVSRVTATLGVEDAIEDVFLPYLTVLGRRRMVGEASVAHERFATHVLRSHVEQLTVDLPSPGRCSAVLACPPGEREDIIVLTISVLLSRAGWSVRFFGADTPLAAVSAASAAVGADVVVLGAGQRELFEAHRDMLRSVAASTPVALGGAGATRQMAQSLGALWLPLRASEAVAVLREGFEGEDTNLTPPEGGRRVM